MIRGDIWGPSSFVKMLTKYLRLRVEAWVEGLPVCSLALELEALHLHSSPLRSTWGLVQGLLFKVSSSLETVINVQVFMQRCP